MLRYELNARFGILTRQAIRRGSFENVRVVTAAIEPFTREWNAGATPFTWVKTADKISPRRSASRKSIPARDASL